MGDISDNSVRARIFGIVDALIQRRQLPGPIRLDQSLRDAGLKSLDLVNVMLAIEDEFGIEIPQNRLTMHHFQTIGSIETLLAEVTS